MTSTKKQLKGGVMENGVMIAGFIVGFATCYAFLRVKIRLLKKNCRHYAKECIRLKDILWRNHVSA